MTPVLACARMCRVQGAKLPAQGCSSIGRAAVSKTAGCRFKSCHPCHRTARTDRPPGRSPQRPPPRGERGAVSDEKPGREDGAAVSGPDAVSDAELTGDQFDREAPGVDDATELEAAEDEIAAEAEADEDKVVTAPARRRRGRITVDHDDEDDETGPTRSAPSRPAGRDGSGTRSPAPAAPPPSP